MDLNELLEQSSVVFSGRIQVKGNEDFLSELAAWIDKGHSKTDLVVMALRAFIEGFDSIPYANNDAGELARLNDEKARERSIRAEFDILNERISKLIEMIEDLKASGLSTEVNDAIQRSDMDDELLQSMRARFDSRNK